MRVIVSGTFDVEPADRDSFLGERVEQMARSRQEPGCEAYVFAADPLDASKVYLFESWASPEALDAHIVALQSRPRLGSDGVRSREVVRHVVESSRLL